MKTEKSTKHQECERRGREKTTKRFGNRLQIDYTKDEYDAVDFYATGSTLYYVGEIKNYDDPDNPRPFAKFDDYMIDWQKLAIVKAKAKAKGRIPLLIVFFDDYTIIWDLTDIDIDSRRKWEWVNKDGQDYGKKEFQLMTHLYESEIKWKEERETTEQRMRLSD